MTELSDDGFALSDKAELEYWFHLAKKRPGSLRLDKGEPDFPAHPVIIEAARELIRGGRVKYSSGIPELKKAIANRLGERIGVEFCPNTEVCITHGAMGGLFASFAVLARNGEHIGIPDICWPTFRLLIEAAGVVPVEYSAFPKRTNRALPESMGSIVVNTPHNPTGIVLSAEQIHDLARMARRANAWVVSDETYEAMTFAQERHISIASLPGMRERTLLVGSFSKTYCMTGWRIGYVAGPRSIVRRIAGVSHLTTGGVSQIAQEAALAALTVPQSHIDNMVAAYERRMRFAATALSSCSYLSIMPPGGTFYLWVGVGNCSGSSRDFARRLLDTYGVASVPGAVFGSAGEGYIRLSLTVEEDQLKPAMERFIECANSFQQRPVCV